MKEKFPGLDIHFPPAKEGELVKLMHKLAAAPWSPSRLDAMGREPTEGHWYFHRDRADVYPACTLCIDRTKPGHWYARNIVPDEGEGHQIPLVKYKAMLSEFEAQIAGPAAAEVEGMASIEFGVYRLEDHFSPQAVKLLEAFCLSSNQGDLGTHPSVVLR
jgi:hypothetical protein